MILLPNGGEGVANKLACQVTPVKAAHAVADHEQRLVAFMVALDDYGVLVALVARFGKSRVPDAHRLQREESSAKCFLDASQLVGDADLLRAFRQACLTILAHVGPGGIVGKGLVVTLDKLLLACREIG